MAFDEGLVQRLREHFDERPDVVEKKMFGGVAFMVRGNMCVGVNKGDLMVRVGKENHAEAVEEPHARTMDFTGRPMTGFVMVSPEGYESDVDLGEWVARGMNFVLTLPPK